MVTPDCANSSGCENAVQHEESSAKYMVFFWRLAWFVCVGFVCSQCWRLIHCCAGCSGTVEVLQTQSVSRVVSRLCGSNDLD
jgi:hypothetical protein